MNGRPDAMAAEAANATAPSAGPATLTVSGSASRIAAARRSPSSRRISGSVSKRYLSRYQRERLPERSVKSPSRSADVEEPPPELVDRAHRSAPSAMATRRSRSGMPSRSSSSEPSAQATTTRCSSARRRRSRSQAPTAAAAQQNEPHAPSSAIRRSAVRRSKATRPAVGSGTVVATIVRSPSRDGDERPTLEVDVDTLDAGRRGPEPRGLREERGAGRRERPCALLVRRRAASTVPSVAATTASTTWVESPTSSERAADASMPAPEATKRADGPPPRGWSVRERARRARASWTRTARPAGAARSVTCGRVRAGVRRHGGCAVRSAPRCRSTISGTIPRCA